MVDRGSSITSGIIEFWIQFLRRRNFPAGIATRTYVQNMLQKIYYLHTGYLSFGGNTYTYILTSLLRYGNVFLTIMPGKTFDPREIVFVLTLG